MQAPVHHQEQYKGFHISLRCHGADDLWEVTEVHIADSSGLVPPLFPRRQLPGRFDSAVLAVERGMGWARAVIDNLDPTLDRDWGN